MISSGRQMSLSIQSAGSVPAIASIDAIVLYDSRDGRVAHMHHLVTFEGAKQQDREGQQRQAMECAQRLGCHVSGLSVIYVSGFRPARKAYRVDPEKQELIEMPLPLRKDRSFDSAAGM